MNPYIQSLRLRTLPLSMSGIILGTGLALRSGVTICQAWQIFVLAICTTLSLQILSNLCNEYGDALKGTDADQQEREAYGLQAGTITMNEIENGIKVTYFFRKVGIKIPVRYTLGEDYLELMRKAYDDLGGRTPQRGAHRPRQKEYSGCPGHQECHFRTAR